MACKCLPLETIGLMKLSGSSGSGGRWELESCNKNCRDFFDAGIIHLCAVVLPEKCNIGPTSITFLGRFTDSTI